MRERRRHARESHRESARVGKSSASVAELMERIWQEGETGFEPALNFTLLPARWRLCRRGQRGECQLRMRGVTLSAPLRNNCSRFAKGRRVATINQMGDIFYETLCPFDFILADHLVSYCGLLPKASTGYPGFDWEKSLTHIDLRNEHSKRSLQATGAGCQVDHYSPERCHHQGHHGEGELNFMSVIPYRDSGLGSRAPHSYHSRQC